MRLIALSLLDSSSSPWGDLCILHPTVLFVRYRLDDTLDRFNVYTLDGFIHVPQMGFVNQGDRIRKLFLDYLNVQAVY